MAADTQYVDQSYAGDNSDGTSARPWTTVQQAIATLASGAIVAIAPGSYEEDLVLVGKAVQLWGRCPADVALVGSAGTFATVLIREGASGSQLAQLAITGASAGVVVSGAVDVDIERVWIHDLVGRGVNVQDELGPTAVRLSDSLVSNVHDIGFFVEGADVSIDGTMLRNVLSGGLGRAIEVHDNNDTGRRSTLGLTGLLVERASDAGVLVIGSDGTIENTVVRDIAPATAALGGRCIAAEDRLETGEPATLDIARSLAERCRDLGVFVGGSSVSMSATVVRDIDRDGVGTYGHGIQVELTPATGNLATVAIASSVVERTRRFGILVAGAVATMDSVVVRDIDSDGEGRWGRGINIEPDPSSWARANVTLVGSSIGPSRDSGLYLLGSDLSVG